MSRQKMTNEKPTNPSHGELLDELLALRGIALPQAIRRFAELRSLILGKMGEGEKLSRTYQALREIGEMAVVDWQDKLVGLVAAALKDDAEQLDYWSSAKQWKKQASRLQSELEEAKKVVALAHEWAAGYPLQGDASQADMVASEKVYAACEALPEARLAAQPDVRELGKLLWLSVEKEAHGWTGIEWEQLPRLARSTWNQHADRLAAHLAPQAGVPNKIGECGEPAEWEQNKAGVDGLGAEQFNTPPLSNEHSPIPSASHTPRCPKCGGEVTWRIGDRNAFCQEQMHMFTLESEADFAQFFPVTSSQGGALDALLDKAVLNQGRPPDIERLAEDSCKAGEAEYGPKKCEHCGGRLYMRLDLPRAQRKPECVNRGCFMTRPTPGPKEQE